LLNEQSHPPSAKPMWALKCI